MPPGHRPAARKTTFERELCHAVGARWLVELRYDGARTAGLFAPHAVFRGADGTISVSGLHLSGPGSAVPDETTSILVIGRIATLKVTDMPFEPARRFDRADHRHENGVICSV
jgi:hypothetical protein